ncbi:MAG TPA: HAD-IIIC family phosphatase, partial [Burkholderiaceae bacterium]
MSMDELLSLLREGRQAEAVDGLAAGRGGWRWHQLEAFGHALDRLPAGLEPAQAGFVASACVTVLSSGTAFPLVGGLAGLLASHRIASRPVDTGYDQWRFGLLRPGVGARPPGTLPHVRVHLCLLDAGVVHPRMALGEALDDTLRRLDTSWQDIASLVDGFLAAGGEHLVLNTIPVPREHLDVVLDFRGKARLARAWCEFNARLLSLAEGDPRIVVLDTASALQDALPDGRFWDARLAARARVQWTPAALAALADAYARTIRALLGQARKCLVTDLDGTLWEGVLGDDGIDGLGIEDGEAGNAHLRLQQAVAALGRQGVILAVNSKNDHERVVQGLQSRAMPLRAGEIACLVANWRPKDENMSHIASQLDIGLDSMVFLDDSRFEREIVRRRHPAVEVVEPGDDPALFVGRLLRAGLFDRPAVTAEDRGRNRSYAAATGQAARG